MCWWVPYLTSRARLSRYIETCGEISFKWGLRSRIEHFPTEENADRPDLLEFIDKWMTDYNTFLDNKAPTGNRKALLSVFVTRFPNSATSSAKLIVRVSAPFFDEKTGEHILRMPRRVLLDLFQRKCVKCGRTWVKDHQRWEKFD